MGPRYRLHADLERELRTLQLRRDIIRSLQQRRLESGREVREFEGSLLQGRVVKAGHHDELGASRWIIVRDSQGVEHFARLGPGGSLPQVGRSIELSAGPGGARVLDSQRGWDRSR